MSTPAQLPGLPDGIDHDAVVAQMIRRAASPGFNAWWQRVEAIGFCANPIHLAGTDGLGREHHVFTRCNNRRAIVCPSCSDLYARDTWQLIHAGLRGGHHNVPTTVAEHPQVFVTLTAPSFGAVHTIRASGSCHPADRHDVACQHHKRTWCEMTHRHDNPALGQPLCADCYDYAGHVLFSWHAPELWRRLTIRLGRLLRQQLRTRGENPDDTRISFMKVVELQRRGLPHFHAVVRLDAASEAGQPPSPPESNFTAVGFVALVRQGVRSTKISTTDGATIRFGDQLDIKVIDSGASSRQVARYLAKYVTKSVSDLGIGPRKFSAGAIDQLDVTEHVREILKTIVTLAERENYREMLSWLHTLGYRGHVTSKSRQFSTTMTALRQHRAAWGTEQAQRAAGSPISENSSSTPTQWEFERVGHLSLGDRVLVVSASDRAQEQRLIARSAIKEGAQND